MSTDGYRVCVWCVCVCVCGRVGGCMGVDVWMCVYVGVDVCVLYVCTHLEYG